MSDRLLLPQELADRLGVKVGTVYALGRAGRIPGTVRVGRLMRFHPDAVDRWIAEGGTAAGEAA